MTSTSVNVRIRVYEASQEVVVPIATVLQGSSLATFNRTFNGLRSNTRHAADLVAGDINNVLLTTCFRTGETPADLSRPLGQYGDINHGDWASGCYAFADLKGPNYRKKVNACLCGARNSSDDWARTDSEAGYEYISSPGYRITLGCTTN